jgi:hypothetical protein
VSSQPSFLATPAGPSALTASAAAGLWIRVSANLSRRKVTWRLTETCLAHFPIPPGAPRSLMQKAAMGFLMELWGNIAEHTVDGRIAGLPDAQLEQWAGWDGEQGAFARWLRAQHLDVETGTVNEWDDFAGALQAKRASDAQRQREKRDRDRRARRDADRADQFEAKLGDVTMPDRPTPSPAAAVPPLRVVDAGQGESTGAANPSPYRRDTLSADDATHFAREMTIALNKGMDENPRIGGQYMPVHASRGDALDVVQGWAGDGVTDWDLMKRVVYTVAKAFEPERRGDQIRSLTFCRERALAMWRRAKARAAAEQAPPIDELPGSAGKPGTGSRRARSQAGALAAASAVGLADD